MGTFTASISGCLPCCGGSLTCYLTLPTNIIDANTTPYVDFATANAALNNSARGAANCIVETLDVATSGFTAAVVGSAVLLHDAFSGPAAGGGRRVLLAANFAAGTLNVGYAAAFDTAGQFDLTLDLHYSNTLIANSVNYNSVNAALSFSGNVAMGVPVADCYQLFVFFRASRSVPTPGSFTADVNVTASNAWTLAPVRAAYTNGAGTSYVSC